MFRTLMNDRVTLVKKDGSRFEDLRAAVQAKLILTDDGKLPIEDGDIFERKLPSGIVESFEILDAGFFQSMPGMPAHYQSKVRKVTSQTRSSPPPQQIVYNLIGPNSRVNMQSTDSSTNVVSVDSTVLFDNLRSAIASSIPDPSLNASLVRYVGEMEKTAGTPGFAQRYKDFISLAADHLSVFAPFLPALSQLLI